MKSLIDLIACLLDDSGRLCSVETVRDLETIKVRTQHEGLSFLTITLPDFATEFERALEQGGLDSTFFTGWCKKACLPVFLQGFTSLVFTNDGRMKYEPPSEAVYCIRQICRVFKKIRIDCSEERKNQAFERFITIERRLDENEAHGDSDDLFARVASLLWSNVFGPGISNAELVPKHGPGATAERVSGNQKYAQNVWTDRLDACFPMDEFLYGTIRQCFCETDGLSNLTVRDTGEELPVRVIQVPKTLKTPRTIAIEPVCMQYMQQAVARWMLQRIRANPLVAGSIRFNDQTVNQRMALQASLDGSSSTLDLSDASDRVPYQKVRLMLESCPELWAAIDACRSRSAELPTGRLLPLAKFASMGSALCFPVESMYFFTIIVYAYIRKHNLPCSLGNFVKAVRGVHVFGDDLIVPKAETDNVIEALHEFQCVVNTTKSFWNGSFRESCGVDGFNGVDVTPTYVREVAPRDRLASSGIISWIATSNLFHRAGMWQTADYMKRVVERTVGSLPTVLDTSPGLGWHSFLGLPKTARSCRYLQVPLVHTYKVRTRRESDTLDGYPALLKYFLRVENREIDSILSPLKQDVKHLTSSARSGFVSRKRQWVPSY